MREDGAKNRQGWLAVAGLCLVAAVAFWWRSLLDATFVAATLGVVAWFLNLRAQLRRKLGDEESPENVDEEEPQPTSEDDEE